jgi:hypothetical protein
MLPEVRIEGRLLGGTGNPLSERLVSMNGPELPPSQDVLCSVNTEKDGTFTIENVPCKSFWFEVGDSKSDPFDFQKPGLHKVRLTYSAQNLACEIISTPSGEATGKVEQTVNYLGQKDFPRVVTLDPPNEAADVDPAREYITVTFDRPMRGGYSWVDKGKRPKLNEIKWISDHECRASVTLEPGRDYGLWLNFGPNTSKFRSVEGISADRVYWSFRTKGEGSSELPEKAKLRPLTEATPSLLASMQPINGCTVEQVSDGVRLSCGGFTHGPRIATERSYSPPFALKVRAMTDSTNLRLYYGEAYSDPSNCGRLIFNWELNQQDLRIHEPVTGNLFRPSGNGYITPDEWHDIVWEIRPDGMRVVVDGEERFRGTGNYSNAQERLGIGPDLGSTVRVQSFVVEPLKQEAPPKYLGKDQDVQ